MPKACDDLAFGFQPRLASLRELPLQLEGMQVRYETDSFKELWGESWVSKFFQARLMPDILLGGFGAELCHAQSQSSIGFWGTFWVVVEPGLWLSRATASGIIDSAKPICPLISELQECSQQPFAEESN